MTQADDHDPTDVKGVKLADFDVHFGDTSNPVFGALPLRVCIAAQWGARTAYSTRAVPAKRVIPLAVDNFEQVFERFGPAFTVDIKDPVQPQAAPIAVHLSWTALADLRPKEIVAKVPELRGFLEALRVLDGATAATPRAQLASDLARVLPRSHFADAVVSAIDQAAPGGGGSAAGSGGGGSAAGSEGSRPRSEGASKGDDLGSLFDLVELGSNDDTEAENTEAEDKPTAASGVGALVNQLAGLSAKGSAPRGGGDGFELGRKRIRELFKQVLVAVLEHPEVRRLEGLWRGAKVLLQAVGRRQNVQLFLAWLAEDDDTDAVEKILAADFDLLCLETTVDGSARSLDQLDSLGTLGAEHQTPVVLNVSPEAIGYGRFNDLNGLRQRLSLVDDPRLTALRMKSAKDSARWISLVGNGLRIRGPHDQRSSRLREADFRQEPSEGAFVVMPPALGLAAVVVGSMQRDGHPFAFIGSEAGALNDLEVQHLPELPDVAVATEDSVGLEAQENAAEIGVGLWAPIRNRAVSVLNAAPLLYRGSDVARGGSGAAEHALSEGIFLARLTRVIREAKRRWQELPDAEFSRRLEAALFELFPNAAPSGPLVSVAVHGDRLQVTVNPRRYGSLRVGELTLDLAR